MHQASPAVPLSERQEFSYNNGMTIMLDQAVESLRALPSETQDDLARMLLQFAGVKTPLLELTAEEAASLDESIAQANRGEFATDDEVRAIWAKHGL